MSSDIDFGELKEDSHARRLRPDQNRQLTVQAVGKLREGELPIYVDLDAARDMELHAVSDKTVELGGVMLGYFCEDEQQQPFVMVTDSLRAAHYESTRGSFKFTHDTWEQITRTREEFPAELQMVGWYHTHPDWGVFLSGLDLFICDNFFNKPLDVALVIDPCRRDRGFFQWTTGRKPRTQQTGGFFLMTSRHRAEELEQFVASLTAPEEIQLMSSTSKQISGTSHVHLHTTPPPPPPPVWQQLAGQVGMFAQLVLLAILVWKIASPPVAETAPANTAPAVTRKDLIDVTQALTARVDETVKQSRSQSRDEARAEFYDDMMRELRGSEPGFVERLQAKYDQTESLREISESQRVMISELQASNQATVEKLEALRVESEERIASLADTVEQLETKKTELEIALRELKASTTPATVAAAEKPAETEGEAETTLFSRKQAIIGLSLLGGGGLLAAIVTFFVRRSPNGGSSGHTESVATISDDKSSTATKPSKNVLSKSSPPSAKDAVAGTENRSTSSEREGGDA
ncbi:Mov34/MPN/PAD-1 family protein [Pirellula staleyi DSM 6068]|uniref:Mov34/MPN/PAD-1 family protein n=1 Tax=Pirellula staleyi (strain ATCC 27377 / DSM 6068 / ICPB 4128) TaxID=530564 RepID=D2R362_PIRSD|nr:Mov34/MPN/PAD-1 family protein [Pirellula staleyi]ADB18795.1 Mov34/MPN/PAD-1 family protein [Pirellula staleyi DSM 6068]